MHGRETLIATLTSVWSAAALCLDDKANEAFFPPSLQGRAERETTPANDTIPNSTLGIHTHHTPNHPEGFIFGSSLEEGVVDIRLGKTSDGFSRRHFTLLYVWPEKGLRLVNHSRHAMSVHNDQGFRTTMSCCPLLQGSASSIQLVHRKRKPSSHVRGRYCSSASLSSKAPMGPS